MFMLRVEIAEMSCYGGCAGADRVSRTRIAQRPLNANELVDYVDPAVI